MILIPLAIAWLCGIWLADSLGLPPWPLACASGLLLAAGLMGWRALGDGRARQVVLVLVCLAGGGARLGFDRDAAAPHPARAFNETGDLRIEGVIAEDPQRTLEGQRVVLAADLVTRDGATRPVSGLVLVKLPPYPARRYGDRLALSGALKTPRDAERPGAFDYRAYLARKKIFSLIEPKATTLRSRGHGSPAVMWLLDARTRAQEVLLRELPEPEASLAVGILLGLQSSIPDDVNATFSVTGTSHILVISGWNITIIATALYALANGLRLPERRAFWLIIATIWLYTLFVGATATVIRAAVMGTIVVVGQRLERPAHAWTTLFAASWAMTIISPQTLWDLGFELSALATASLFAFGKPTEALLLRTPLARPWLGWAREALTATLAAQILALPLILYHFGNLSIIAPLANVALLPMVPYAMLFGALALAAGLVWLPLGQALASAAYLFLAWLTEGARWFAGVPGAAVQLPPFPLWMLVGYYTIVVGSWLWNCAIHLTSDQLTCTLGGEGGER